MFMKKTSFAAFNGIHAFIEKCATKGGCLDVAEKERMSIVQQFKDPIDQLGRLLKSSQRIERLCISVQAPKFQITFLEYLLEDLSRSCVVGGATLYFASSTTTPWRSLDEFQLRRLEHLLQLTPKKPKKEPQLPPEVNSMYRLLQAIRLNQQLDPMPMPDWLSPMPA